ncbi:hypothetical protein EVJ58_g7572 [Rhodofomes roseus]|uniref:Ribonuclease H1 N-terminal domain-containing protein n=1 Tax=Rhodofomes roseus TaxID=34475 RepID=A0A4Y9Y264_9APHY|nr:hypothetical protein EVJ58_g7572 [Rhodofomes roseus]
MQLPPNPPPPNDDYNDHAPEPELAELTPQELAVAVQIYRIGLSVRATNIQQAAGQGGLDDLHGLAAALPDVDGLAVDAAPPPPPTPTAVAAELPTAGNAAPPLPDVANDGGALPAGANDHAALLVAPPAAMNVAAGPPAAVDVQAPMVAVGVQVAPAPPIDVVAPVHQLAAPPVVAAAHVAPPVAAAHVALPVAAPVALPVAAAPVAPPVAPPVPAANVAQVPHAPIAVVPHAPAAQYTAYIDDFDASVDTWYVVYRGTRVGVFAHWDEASIYVIGVSGSSHKGFSQYRMAVERFRSAEARGTVRQI